MSPYPENKAVTSLVICDGRDKGTPVTCYQCGFTASPAKRQSRPTRRVCLFAARKELSAHQNGLTSKILQIQKETPVGCHTITEQSP